MTSTPPEPAPILVVDCWRVDTTGTTAEQAARWDAAEPDQRARAAQSAVAALRALTGGAVEPCLYTTRPCARPCTPGTWQTYSVRAAGFAPRLDSGTWINVHCGACDADRCGHDLTSIRLPGATRVTEVWVDGALLDGDTDYLLLGDKLVRLDGLAWPRCQNVYKSREEADTFEVTYYRRRPGPAGEQAAGRLAVEYLAAALGGACALPASVTNIARAGVTITKTPGAFPGGLTGVREVDAWVATVNPARLTGPSEVLTPDTYRR